MIRIRVISEQIWMHCKRKVITSTSEGGRVV